MLPEFSAGDTTALPQRPPYVSVVVTARNDHLGGNLLPRMQAFLNAWLEQAKRYNLPSEIIVVEWNPPLNRPKLKEALQWPADIHPCEVRFIEVPAEVHRRFKNADVIPMHQMIARNTGIRRARGEFVLATNPDAVFSAELMKFLAERRPEARTLYRIDRYDVPSAVPNPATLDQLMAYCENHIVRVLASEGEFELGQDGARALETNDIVPPDAGIRFGPGCYPVESDEGALFRWLADDAQIVVQRPLGVAPNLILEAETGPSAGGGAVEVQVVDPANSVLASVSFKGHCQLLLHMPDQISEATLRFRIRSAGIPLERDVRTLNLRLFGVRWADQSFMPGSRPFTGQAGQAGISVRSVDSRRVQLQLNPGPGSSLESLEANLTDLAGNTIFHVSTDQLQPAPGREHVLTLNVGFTLSGREGSSISESGDDSNWLLEVAGTKPGVDWSHAFQAPSPWASQMRNPAYLHTNASGDFTLLSRKDWFDLRGYAEFPIWPTHIDTLFCYAAHHAGVRQIVLREPLRIFHIERLSEADSTPEALDDPVKSKCVAQFQNDDVVKWVDQMRRFNAPVIFTQRNWGLADVQLPETRVT